MRKIRENYTVVENTKCDTCGAITDCFRFYKLENGLPVVDYNECGYDCDLETDARGAELEEDLQNPENWRTV